MMQVLEQFQLQGWEMIFASPAQAGEKRADLAALGIAEKTIALNCSSFDSWVKALQPNIVLFDRFMMEEQFGWRVAEQCPQALRVLETSDLHSLRETRQLLLKKRPQELRDTVPDYSFAELYGAMARADITRRELASIYRCDLTLFTSTVEMQLLVEQFRVPATLLCYCPFMLETPDSSRWPTFAQRKNFVSIGNFLHTPNWDSVLWLQQAIWPLIRKQLPDVDCFIYGAYTPQKALDLHNPKQGFHVQGFAEDALQVMREARICLAPLRFGAGIKGKLADAMLCGTPLLTTSIGAESMDLSAYAHNSAKEIADAAIELYNMPAKWEAAQQQGAEILRRRFNKQEVGQRLIGQIRNCLDHLEQHRLANFTGQMLQHHAHKSTEYMARWIEAKNKRESL
jgi:glycosyltransferase involved in cell wall biosynthesis